MRGKKRSGPRRVVCAIATVGLLLTMGISCFVLLQIASLEPRHGGADVPNLHVSGEVSSNAFTRCPSGRYAKIDDNYCDCRGFSGLDTREEARTSACSYDTVGIRVFHCKRDLPGQEFIFSSRVLDGVNDCCDCSDEITAGGSECPNRCVSPRGPAKKKLLRARARERGHGGETR